MTGWRDIVAAAAVILALVWIADVTSVGATLDRAKAACARPIEGELP